MSNDIESLRDELFDTIRRLKDKADPLDVARAKAISDVAGRIIDSAKVEVQFTEVTGQRTSGTFLPAAKEAAPYRPRALRLT